MLSCFSVLVGTDSDRQHATRAQKSNFKSMRHSKGRHAGKMTKWKTSSYLIISN